jgi:acyl-CoA thioester hydrolase
MKPIPHETRLRVRYAETDQMGVVYYANYFVWMEVGRVELCRALGVRYRDLEAEDGVRLAVAEATCRYSFPARYDEEVIVKTWIAEANPRMVRFAYEIANAESGRKLVTGETRHIFCNQEMKPARLPPRHYSLFGIAPASRKTGSV